MDSPPPPPSDYFKVNVDGAILDNGRHSCIGIIIRDCSGSPFGALSKHLTSDFPAMVTKACPPPRSPFCFGDADSSCHLRIRCSISDSSSNCGRLWWRDGSYSSRYQGFFALLLQLLLQVLEKGRQQSNPCISQRSQTLRPNSDMEGCHFPSHLADSKGWFVVILLMFSCLNTLLSCNSFSSWNVSYPCSPLKKKIN